MFGAVPRVTAMSTDGLIGVRDREGDHIGGSVRGDGRLQLVDAVDGHTVDRGDDVAGDQADRSRGTVGADPVDVERALIADDHVDSQPWRVLRRACWSAASRRRWPR